MAKRKASTNPPAERNATNDDVEPMVIALAEQLGSFMGRVQAKADGWLENEALRQQVSQIRDGATQLLDRVNRAGAAARDSVAKVVTAAKPKAKSATKPLQATGRSGGAVDAPGKRHRKPPPQESIDKRMGEPKGKQAGQKQFTVGKSRGRR
jgi:hypothetical protein